MKIKISELVNGNTLLGGIFLDSITKEDIKKITSAEDYNVDTTKLDIELTIGGINIDAREYFKKVNENYNKAVRMAAKHIITENYKSKLSDIESSLYELSGKLDAIVENVDWDDLAIELK